MLVLSIPAVGIPNYHSSIEIAANKLWLWVIWTLFLSDSWQMVAVALGFRSHIQISVEEIPEEWRLLLGSFSIFVFFFNPWSLDKGLSSQRFLVWLLALKIPGDPHCALQRLKCKSHKFREHIPVILGISPYATNILCGDGDQKTFSDLQDENSAL